MAVCGYQSEEELETVDASDMAQDRPSSVTHEKYCV